MTWYAILDFKTTFYCKVNLKYHIKPCQFMGLILWNLFVVVAFLNASKHG